MKREMGCMLIIAMMAIPARCQQPLTSAEPASPQVKLEVSPAAEPELALRYGLPPNLLEQTPGNAATRYYRAILMIRPEARKLLTENFQSWDTGEVDDKKLHEIDKCLSLMGSAMSEAKAAAFTERCDWDMRLTDLRGADVFLLLLPEVAEIRLLGRAYGLKARVHIARGELDEAFEAIRVGWRIARHVTEAKIIVNGLVGVSIARQMCDRLEELIAAPGSANLYWAIQSLPKPMIDLLPATLGERDILYAVFPLFRDIEKAELSPAQWKSAMSDVAKVLSALNTEVDKNQQATLSAIMAKTYPVAKQTLIKNGVSKKNVEAMPMEQVFLLHLGRQTVHTYHAFFKWMLLPYHLGRDRLARAEHELFGKKSDKESSPIASLMLPALGAVMDTQVALERRVALLANVEAIRMHAADNNGRLPEALDDIRVVPILADPATGKSFTYRVDGKTAYLSAPALKIAGKSRPGRQLVITFK